MAHTLNYIMLAKPTGICVCKRRWSESAQTLFGFPCWCPRKLHPSLCVCASDYGEFPYTIADNWQSFGDLEFKDINAQKLGDYLIGMKTVISDIPNGYVTEGEHWQSAVVVDHEKTKFYQGSHVYRLKITLETGEESDQIQLFSYRWLLTSLIKTFKVTINGKLLTEKLLRGSSLVVKNTLHQTTPTPTQALPAQTPLPTQNTDKAALLHRRIRTRFPGQGDSVGRVREYILQNDSYVILYDDGDEEEQTYQRVLEMLKETEAYDTEDRTAPKLTFAGDPADLRGALVRFYNTPKHLKQYIVKDYNTNTQCWRVADAINNKNFNELNWTDLSRLMYKMPPYHNMTEYKKKNKVDTHKFFMVLYLGIYVTWLHIEMWHLTKTQALAHLKKNCGAGEFWWPKALSTIEMEKVLRTLTIFKIGKGAGDYTDQDNKKYHRYTMQTNQSQGLMLSDAELENRSSSINNKIRRMRKIEETQHKALWMKLYTHKEGKMNLFDSCLYTHKTKTRFFSPHFRMLGQAVVNNMKLHEIRVPEMEKELVVFVSKEFNDKLLRMPNLPKDIKPTDNWGFICNSDRGWEEGDRPRNFPSCGKEWLDAATVYAENKLTVCKLMQELQNAMQAYTEQAQVQSNLASEILKQFVFEHIPTGEHAKIYIPPHITREPIITKPSTDPSITTAELQSQIDLVREHALVLREQARAMRVQEQGMNLLAKNLHNLHVHH